jgi:hypothetical protein
MVGLHSRSIQELYAWTHMHHTRAALSPRGQSFEEPLQKSRQSTLVAADKVAILLVFLLSLRQRTPSTTIDKTREIGTTWCCYAVYITSRSSLHEKAIFVRELQSQVSATSRLSADTRQTKRLALHQAFSYSRTIPSQLPTRQLHTSCHFWN